MTPPSKPSLVEGLKLRLQNALEKQGRRVWFYVGGSERLLVRIDRRAFLILLPETNQPLTPTGVEKRVKSWPGLRGRTAEGHVILANAAPLSTTLEATREKLPPNVAVVGRWGVTNELAASAVDADMALILEAAGVGKHLLLKSANNEPDKIKSQPTPLEANPSRNVVAHLGSNSRILRPGHRLDCYKLERRLGRGHSAEVWKAEVADHVTGVDLAPKTSVAVKVYFPSLMEGFQTLRIQREFSVAAGLSHPNLARVYDLVLSPSRPFHTFMAMEYIAGPTLKSLVDRNGSLSPHQVASIALQLFGALSEIHSHGALHRDVKAANIMVSSIESMEIKLVDLGIVSIPTEDRFTAASVFMGSKHSAPIEQLTGEALDERTDIYGAGSVLFHCLQGRPMYSDVGPEGAIVRRMLAKPELLPSQARDSGTSIALADFINRCIAVEKQKRPETAEDCIANIRRIVGLK